MDISGNVIIDNIIWNAFAKTMEFYNEQAKDFALKLYISNELRALDKLSDGDIGEITDVIETTIIEIPDEIKQLKEPKEQREAFEKYFNKHEALRKIKAKNYFEKIVIKKGATLNQHFGDVHNYPKH